MPTQERSTPDARGLLEQAGLRADKDGVITNETMSEVHSPVSTQLFYVLAMTCRGRAVVVVQRVQEGYGFEVWRQLCREFEPRLPARFQGILQAVLQLPKSVDVESNYKREQRLKQYEEQSGDTVSDAIKTSVLTSHCIDPERPATPEPAGSEAPEVQRRSKGGGRLPSLQDDLERRRRRPDGPHATPKIQGQRPWQQGPRQGRQAKRTCAFTAGNPLTASRSAGCSSTIRSASVSCRTRPEST